jgi:hypothetical protein
VSVDLNSYVTTGAWHQSQNAWAGGGSGGTNYPVAAAGMLTVLTVSGSMVYQQYQTYGTSNRKFFRALYSSVWSSWVEETPTASPTLSGTITLGGSSDIVKVMTHKVWISQTAPTSNVAGDVWITW